MSRGPSSASAVELTRRLFDSANGGDLDVMMCFFAENSVWDVSDWGLGTHAGSAAIRTFFGDWIGGFDEYRVEIEEILDLGGGIVFVVACQHAGLARTRGALRLRYAAIFAWSGDIVLSATHHQNVDEARALAKRLAADTIAN
jgi:ketosteroid isomerase-like protein